MDERFWKAVAVLGPAGLALGLFYKLYDKFDWPLRDLPAEQIFVLVLVFMVLIAAVVIYTLFLWRPKDPVVKHAGTDVTISIPKGFTLRGVAKAIGGDRVVKFEGFSENELSSPLVSRQITATSPERLIELLSEAATRSVRPYRVSRGAGGEYIARVIQHT